MIKNERPLRQAFVPEKILHREGQKQELANCLEPALDGRKPRNVFLHGPCGTGKTMLVKWTLEKLGEQSADVKTSFVNCWKESTMHSTLSTLLKGLDIHLGSGTSTSKALDFFEEEANERNVVVALDEVDTLENKKLLYNLSRADAGIVVISNKKFALAGLDARTKSSLSPEEINFPAYSNDEIFDIIKERAKYAFVSGTAPNPVLRLISRLSNGDARIAIETLRRSGMEAEQKGEKKVTEAIVKQEFKKMKHLRKSEALKQLNDHEKTLYEMMDDKWMKGPDMYEEYSEKQENAVGERSFRNYLGHLADLGLLETKGKTSTKKYRKGV